MVEQVRALPASAVPVDPSFSGAFGSTSLRAHALLRATRPRQWPKNLLVLAAPAAAGIASQPATLARISASFAAFSLVAAAAYLFNDLADRNEDRLHPGKCGRPIASGLVTPLLAAASAATFAVAGRSEEHTSELQSRPHLVCRLLL